MIEEISPLRLITRLQFRRSNGRLVLNNWIITTTFPSSSMVLEKRLTLTDSWLLWELTKCLKLEALRFSLLSHNSLSPSKVKFQAYLGSKIKKLPWTPEILMLFKLLWRSFKSWFSVEIWLVKLLFLITDNSCLFSTYTKIKTPILETKLNIVRGRSTTSVIWSKKLWKSLNKLVARFNNFILPCVTLLGCLHQYQIHDPYLWERCYRLTDKRNS